MTALLERALAVLRGAGVSLDAGALADALWLASHLPRPDVAAADAPAAVDGAPPTRDDAPPRPPPAAAPDPRPVDPPAPATSARGEPPEPASVATRGTAGGVGGGAPVRAPTTAALPRARALARALRPLERRTAPSRERELDVEATVERCAETGVWVPVWRRARGPWLALALVVDVGRSMDVWRRTAAELHRVLARAGAFRAVAAWSLDTDAAGRVVLRAGLRGSGPAVGLRALVDPGGLRATLVVTDCVSPAWHDGGAASALRAWGAAQPTALLQVLPQPFWLRTGLRHHYEVRLSAAVPARPNGGLRCDPARAPTDRPLPVVPLEPGALGQWAAAVAGRADVGVLGVLLEASFRPFEADGEAGDVGAPPSGASRVAAFRALASRPAWRLARVCAAAPVVTLPVLRILREVFAPEADARHLAEVMLGGLLREEEAAPAGASRDPDAAVYELVDGAREALLAEVPVATAAEVIERVSDYVARECGAPVDFGAVVRGEGADVAAAAPVGRVFARVAPAVLRALGVGVPAAPEAAAPAGGLRVFVACSHQPDDVLRPAAEALGGLLAARRDRLVARGYVGAEARLARVFAEAVAARGDEPTAWVSHARRAFNLTARPTELLDALTSCDCAVLLADPRAPGRAQFERQDGPTEAWWLARALGLPTLVAPWRGGAEEALRSSDAVADGELRALGRRWREEPGAMVEVVERFLARQSRAPAGRAKHRADPSEVAARLASLTDEGAAQPGARGRTLMVVCSTDGAWERTLAPLAEALGRALAEARVALSVVSLSDPLEAALLRAYGDAARASGFAPPPVTAGLLPGRAREESETLDVALRALAPADVVLFLTSPRTRAAERHFDPGSIATLADLCRLAGAPVIAAPRWGVDDDPADALAERCGGDRESADAVRAVGARWAEDPGALAAVLVERVCSVRPRARPRLRADAFDPLGAELARSVCAVVDPEGRVWGTGFVVLDDADTVLTNASAVPAPRAAEGWAAEFVVPVEADCVRLRVPLRREGASLVLPPHGVAAVGLAHAGELRGVLRPLDLAAGAVASGVAPVTLAWFSPEVGHLTLRAEAARVDEAAGELSLDPGARAESMRGAPVLRRGDGVVAVVTKASPAEGVTARLATAILRSLSPVYGRVAERLRARAGLGEGEAPPEDARESAAPPPAQEGPIVAARYRLEARIGGDGPRATYAARDLRSGARVALELYAAEGARAPERAARFEADARHEARCAAEVAHPAVLAVSDVGRDEALGAPYLVRELVDARDLREELRTAGRLDAHATLELLSPVMEALAATHACGYVHRAVAPANVLVARDASGAASVRLKGFEHCCRAGDALQPTTHVGVPGYLAPEQIVGRADLDGRVDVWAVGALAFEALTGAAFTADPLAQVLPFERLSAFAPRTPAAFVAAVVRALHADRDQRFPTARALLDALRDAAAPSPAAPTAPRALDRFAVLVARSTDPSLRGDLAALAATFRARLAEEGFHDLSLPPGEWALASLLNALARADVVILLTSPLTLTDASPNDVNRLASLGHLARAAGVPVVTAPHWDARDAAHELALALGDDAFAPARRGVGERWRDEPRALVDVALAHLARLGRLDRGALPTPADFDPPSRALSRSVCALVDPAGAVRGTGFLVGGRVVLSPLAAQPGWRARFVVPMEAGCVGLTFALEAGAAHLALPEAGASLWELPPSAQLLGNLGRPLPLRGGRVGDRPLTSVAVAAFLTSAGHVAVLPGPLAEDPVTGRLTLLGILDGDELAGAPALAPSGEVVAWVASATRGRRAATPAAALLRALREAPGELAGRLRATLGVSRAAPATTSSRAGWHGEAMPPNLARKLDGAPHALRQYVWADPAGGEVVLAYVAPGEFVRGSNDGFVNERPAHPCVLSRGYYAGVHPITVAQFARFVDATGHDAGPAWRARATLHPDHPVTDVRWSDAAAWCAWSGLRLLTEAEWEFAARGATRSVYPWGDVPPDDARACWSGHALRVGPAPVGQRPLSASPFGLHDLAGNVWEWTADWYGRYPGGDGLLRDPAGPPAGSARVIRGGGWRDTAAHSLRAAGRDALAPTSSADHVGFRCALSAAQDDRG